jgi:large subunit ribosomal protein L28
MSHICDLCGRRPTRGYSIARRGLAKKKGGVGRKITGRTKRSFRPNVQRVRALWQGRARRLKVCTTCLRSGKIVKPPRRPRPEAAAAAPTA